VIITDKLWKENSYLVTHENSGKQIIIDPGAIPNKIIDIIEKHGNGKIEHILLTHAHFDHIGAVSSISKYFNIPCLVHEGDYKLLKQCTMYAIKFGGRVFEIPNNVIKFSSGFEIDIDKMKILIIETPGHTKGGVSYVFDGFLFSGDSLLFKSIGRADLPGSDLESLKYSVDKILNSSKNETIIFSGHGIQWSIAEAKEWWINGKLSLPQHNMFIKS
jgi:hydroxyacylglutathione hydrolase